MSVARCPPGLGSTAVFCRGVGDSSFVAPDDAWFPLGNWCISGVTSCSSFVLRGPSAIVVGFVEATVFEVSAGVVTVHVVVEVCVFHCCLRDPDSNLMLQWFPTDCGDNSSA